METDIRSQIIKHLQDKGISINSVANAIETERSHLRRVLIKERLLSEELRKKLNAHLDTAF